jgi:hypothetical protein
VPSFGAYLIQQQELSTQYFTAQLSNAAGNWTLGNYWNLSSTVVTVSGTIPVGSVRTGYRIRVVSSNPAVTGSTNLSNLIVNATSAPNSRNNYQPTCAVGTGSVV